jgi:hypothetical protein
MISEGLGPRHRRRLRFRADTSRILPCSLISTYPDLNSFVISCGPQGLFLLANRGLEGADFGGVA